MVIGLIGYVKDFQVSNSNSDYILCKVILQCCLYEQGGQD